MHKDIQKAIDKYREIEAMRESERITRLDSEPLEPVITQSDLELINSIDEAVLPAFLQTQAF